MKKCYPLLLLACLLFADHLIARTGKIRAKILRPATVTIPSRIQKIVLAERGRGTCIISATGQRLYGWPDTTRYSQLGYLRELLTQTQRYSIEMAAMDTAWRAHEKEQLLPPLEWSAVGRLAGYDSTAILIVLEEVDARSIGDYQNEHRVWRIYDYHTRTILDEFDHHYEYQGVIRGERRNVYLPSMALRIYAERIMPYWETVIREYYNNGDARMKAAAVCLQSLDWTGACVQWQAVVKDSTRNRALAAKACLNMAVHYELAGDFMKAQEWNNRAGRMGNELASEFARIIRGRIAEAPAVNQQVANKQGQMPALTKDYRPVKQWSRQPPPEPKRNQPQKALMK